MNEGNTVIVTLTRGSSATKPIKGTVRTEACFAQADDIDHGSTTVNHNGESKEVEIDTTQDTRIEGDESFRVKRINDHNYAVSSCLVLILDDDAYRFGEQIIFELTLDANVKVYGQPGLKITVGESVSGDRSSNADAGTQVGQADRTRWAVYDADLTWHANGSSEGPTVIFVYEVGPTDKASGGVAVPENDDDRTQFVIPGSTALLDDDGNAIEDRFEVKHNVTSSPHVTYQAHYDHDGLAADSDHAVDGTDPLIEIDFGSVNSALGATLTFWNIPNDDGDLTWPAVAQPVPTAWKSPPPLTVRSRLRVDVIPDQPLLVAVRIADCPQRFRRRPVTPGCGQPSECASEHPPRCRSTGGSPPGIWRTHDDFLACPIRPGRRAR